MLNTRDKATFELDAHAIQRILMALVAEGRPFECAPLPDDQWQVVVKDEYRESCRQIVSGRADVYFEDGRLGSEKCPGAVVLWENILANDVESAQQTIAKYGDKVARAGRGLLLQRAATEGNKPITQLLLKAGAAPKDWWDDDTHEFISAVRDAGHQGGLSHRSDLS